MGTGYPTYAETRGPDNKGKRDVLVSISAMPQYAGKSHAELRYEDYLEGKKGGR